MNTNIITLPIASPAGVQLQSLLLLLIPVAVPLLVAIGKWVAPKIPTWVLPIAAPALGALLDFLSSLATGHVASPIIGALLGSAGVGLREVKDQIQSRIKDGKPDITPPTSGTGSTTIPLLLLCGLMAASTPVFVTGCGSAPTKEAKVFYTFKDSWTLSHQAYATWTERVVLGKVTPEAEAKADAAWNKYRQSYKVALHLAQGSLSAGIPATLLATQNELLNLIATFSK